MILSLNADIKERVEMIQRGEVPEGYKKTKVGIIPEDWEVKRLGEIAEIISGGTPSTTVETYWDGEIPWCTPTDITSSSKYIENTTRYISEEGLNNSSAQLLPANSILMCSRATIGPRSINKIPMTTNQGFKSFVCKEDKLYFEFLYYLLEIYVSIFIRKSNGSTFLEISKRDTQKTKVAIPRLSEQQKIAKILSTWDEAIDLKEKLIEEKQEQKKGLMQNLLTGKVRLPGFEGEWEEVRLGEVISECKDKTSKNNQYPILTSSRRGVFLHGEYFSKQVASAKNIGYKIFKKGYFTYRTMSDDGYFTFNRLEDYDIGIVSPAYVVFRAIKINPIFLKELINSYNFNKYIIQVIQGGTRLSLRYNQLKDVKVNLPPIQEQKAIADVLSTADREIELLKEEVELLKEQKKGLMQLLLTGIVRVKC